MQMHTIDDQHQLLAIVVAREDRRRFCNRASHRARRPTRRLTNETSDDSIESIANAILPSTTSSSWHRCSERLMNDDIGQAPIEEAKPISSASTTINAARSASKTKTNSEQPRISRTHNHQTDQNHRSQKAQQHWRFNCQNIKSLSASKLFLACLVSLALIVGTTCTCSSLTNADSNGNYGASLSALAVARVDSAEAGGPAISSESGDSPVAGSGGSELVAGDINGSKGEDVSDAKADGADAELANIEELERLPSVASTPMSSPLAVDDQLIASASALKPAAASSSSSSSARPARQTQPTTTTVDEHTFSDATVLSQAFDYHANMPVITKRELANAIKQATASVRKLRDSTEVNLFNSQLVMEAGSPSWLANSMAHRAALDARALNQTNQALISEEATRILAKQYKLNRVQILRGLPLISVDQTNLGKVCQRPSKTFNCIAGRYRSLTGHCNNVQNPDWGSAQTSLVRYALAQYSDHVSKPIKSASAPLPLGSQTSLLLPSARAVSMAIYSVASQHQPAAAASSPGSEATSDLPAIGGQHSHMTTMMSFFGQFVFHDLASVSQYTGFGRAMIKCCDVNAASQHPECMPIEYSDGRQQQLGQHYCLDYVRSTPATRSGCNLGHRDQLNLVSSFLDGSTIYGSSEEQMRRLRTFSGGRLRSQRANVGNPSTTSTVELLPQIKLQPAATSGQQQQVPLAVNDSSLDAVWALAAEDCRQMAKMKQQRRRQQQQSSSNQIRSESGDLGANDQSANSRCFQAGDSRVNENIGLTLMHTIWMREHNYIADKLAQLNKHWRDERIFEESRRLVIAELQHITYSEFLHSIVGEEVMQRFNLSVQSQGYFQGYDPQVNAGISNELATAVFPFILSTIPHTLERYSERLEMLGSTSVADTFMDASDLFKRNKFAQYLMGMMSQNAMEPVFGVMPMTMDMNSHDNRAQHQRAKRQVAGSFNNSNSQLSAADRTLLPQVDIVALTIQQGRDHGLKSYLYWRQTCQLRPTIKSWQDLTQIMPASVVERLQQVYASVDQLDLYLALLESPLPGATVGPTLVCLLARQFFHLKHGDRYWYENDLPGTVFAPKQLEQIRQTTLAKVVCRNSQSTISFIQPSPMIASDPYLNAYQYCTNRAMVDLDLIKWRQPVQSAAQITEESLMSDLDPLEISLVRGKRLVEQNSRLIVQSLHRAKRQLDSVAYEEIVKLRRSRRAAGGFSPSNGFASHHGHMMTSSPSSAASAGYRYLPRLKRQALKINNQSLIFELATNEVVRLLLRRGKDREHAQSIQSDIRDFLYSLESIQLDNLLENSGESARLQEFISSAGDAFLTPEQKLRLQQSGDTSLNSDPVFDFVSASASASTTTELQSSSRSSSISTNCQDDDRVTPCDHTTPFRTITGWCNNLQNPKFGQSFTLLDRILPNAYEDGLSRPRQFSIVLASQQTGERLPLPSARLISTTMHDDKSHLHSRYSLALMQFGQFGVDHDLTRTPFSVALDGSLLDCSPCDSKQRVHRDCLPIEIPDDDAHFNSPKARELMGTGKKCLHFVRSLNGQTGLGPRQQINALTAYIDASNIYGSDNCEAKSLRSFVGGKLNSSQYPAGAANVGGFTGQPKEILPTTRANPECVTPSGVCFLAGDQRASEQPGLTAIHTVFMRLHNSIVSQLASINRHWTDEKLYQHGRRIVAAIMQRITYNEFAPRLLGLDYMSKFDLILKNVGYSDHYDDSCSASVLTEFAAAAFRMGHSLIRNAFTLLNKQYKPIGKAFHLRKAFFNSQRILTEPHLIDSILRGVVSTPIETLDNSITDELTNHLFERPKEPFSGMDLISLNIQRARDHGIGPYNKYRVKCNLTRARTFEDLSAEVSTKLIKRLAGLYASVDDIDLFTGGMSEMPVHGGLIGPTLGCIIGMQFSRLKRCDRFWHETADPWVRFSAPQLAEIRKMTLAKVICQESDNIDLIQRNAMDISDQYLNPRVACSSLPTMDLSFWRENLKSCLVNKVKLELGQSKRIGPCKSCTCTLEGPVCRTAKINCLQAMKQSGKGLSNIMADKSCLVQCAWALDMQPSLLGTS